MKRLLLILAMVLLGGCSTSPDGREPLSATPQEMPHHVQMVRSGVVLSKHPTTPRHLVLPNTSARVIPIHLQGSELIPPSDPQVLGWWGRKAGAPHGTTVLVGHTVHRAAWHIYGKGKLNDLENVPAGATIKVSGVSYKVISNRIISKAELSRQAPAIFSQTGNSRLTIVTCENYHANTGIYSSNVVLTAVLAG